MGYRAEVTGTQLFLLGLHGGTGAERLHRRHMERSEASEYRNADLRCSQRYNADRHQSLGPDSRLCLQGRHGSHSGLPITLRSHPPFQVGTAL